MSRGSLRVRLLAAGAGSILIALALAGLGLTLLFERHVERRVIAELELNLRQLIGHLGFDADGTLRLERPLSDPRFEQPLSGLYWQVMTIPPRPALRSRSLWDETLELPVDPLPSPGVHRHVVPGPQRAVLLVVERSVDLPRGVGGGSGGGAIRAAVAIDRAEVHAAGRAFAGELLPSLALLFAVLLAAARVQVSVGLRPLDTIRRKLSAIRAGLAARIGDDFPDEVLPLAAEIDSLLAAQEASLERARGHAADLAHGLKTPLTVLADDARQLGSRGDMALAAEISELVEGMRRHVERQLARARAGARSRGGAHQPVAPVAAQVVEVMQRTPRGRELRWQVDVPADLAAAVDGQDLTEMLGNLVENAGKWARKTVRVSGKRSDGATALVVEDDGPGVPESEQATVLARGGRLDASKSGAGLGLAIVGDLAEAYGGSLALGKSPLGGLQVELRLPGRGEAVPGRRG